MSEDDKEKPKKLRLSRDISKDTGENKIRSSEKVPEDESPPSEDEAKQMSQDAPRDEAPVSSPAPPELKKQPEPSGLSTDRPATKEKDAREPGPAPDSVPQSNLKLSQESKNSQASGGEDEPAQPESDQAMRQSQPTIDEGKSHSILPSLIVVALLFLLLGAAGFGLWKIVFSVEDSTVSQSITVSEGGDDGEIAEEAAKTNPIERAKQTIAKVPQLDMDTVTGDSGPAHKRASEAEAPHEVQAPETDREPTIAPDRNAQTNPARPPEAPTESTAVIESTKATVSEFLASLHIDGMRQGSRPMLLIDGRAHNVGDTIQTETGLTFQGIRDGKLAFIDKNGIVYLKSF